MQGKFDLLISDGEKLISSLLTAPCVFPNDPSHVYTVFDGASLNTRYILYLVLKVNIFVCVDVVSTRFIFVCVVQYMCCRRCGKRCRTKWWAASLNTRHVILTVGRSDTPMVFFSVPAKILWDFHQSRQFIVRNGRASEADKKPGPSGKILSFGPEWK